LFLFRCTVFGLKLVPFPQLSVSKDVYLNPFKAHVTFKITTKDEADHLDTVLDRLDYLHDGVFFTDALDIKECVSCDFDFARRWSQTVAGRQFVHRSGTLFVRILTDMKGRALVVVFGNYNYFNKDETARFVSQNVFSELATSMNALDDDDDTWEEAFAARKIARAGEKPIEKERIDPVNTENRTVPIANDSLETNVQHNDETTTLNDASTVI
jgi:hypothetical protein